MKKSKKAKPVKPAKGAKLSKSEVKQAGLAQAKTQIKQEHEFFHDPDGMPWDRVHVNGHFENLPIRGQKFELLITKGLRDLLGFMPKKSEVKEVLREFEGNAIFDGPEYTLHLRTAATGDAIYIDLCDDQWNVVKVTPAGWSLVSEDIPVRFRRSEGMRPLPAPQRLDGLRAGTMLKRKDKSVYVRPTGPITAERVLQSLFRSHINIQNREHQILVLTWLVAAFRPKGPYPVLAFHGQQGSAKTTAQTLLKKLIDPSVAPMRTAPRDERDLMISAKHSYVLGFDNFSNIPNWLSDALCRLVTGGGFATRQLYTDEKQTVFDGARAIMFNGIDDIAERGDLLDRMLVVRCDTLDAAKRKPEEFLTMRFSALYPYVLGALLDVVAKTMAKYPEVQADRGRFPNGLPRMADFAVWATAAEEALGYESGEFIKAYEDNRQELRMLALEFSPAITALIDWKRGRKDGIARYDGHKADWTGTHQELLEHLGHHRNIGTGTHANVGVRTSKALAVEIARAEPNLRTIGIVIEHLPREAGTGRRLIHITDVVETDQSNRAKVCDAYRKNHPEFAHESNSVIYKRAMKQGSFSVTTVTPSQADAAKA